MKIALGGNEISNSRTIRAERRARLNLGDYPRPLWGRKGHTCVQYNSLQTTRVRSYWGHALECLALVLLPCHTTRHTSHARAETVALVLRAR